jgi:putative nucleotidyltransferase with HDIG domain
MVRKEQALALLRRYGAARRLLLHVELVGEAGDELISVLERLGAEIDTDFIRSGIVLHDIGKTIHHSELEQDGESHRETGRDLLRREGVEPGLADVCMSHSAWSQAETVEELVIACSDKLWKGSRVADLEEALVQRLAADLGLDYWAVSTAMDRCFEAIADRADERMERSRLG